MRARWASFAVFLALAGGFAATGGASKDTIPAAEFSKIIRTFSEEEGYFLSDNLISNEDGYLAVVPKLRSLSISGGAYIGVGPEQNFTYIAKLRPSIAFLIDIRRQAVIQHLMYKALFHLSKDRAQFISRLLSRSLSGKGAPEAQSSLYDLMEYFSRTPPSAPYLISNLADVERAIQSDFKFPLLPEDRDSLAGILQSFYADGVDVSFQFRSPRRGRGRGGYGMPSLRELIEQMDPEGTPGNFLASAEEYRFVRELHEKNRIIPVVGDFAGTKALKSIARYLREHAYKVNAFYTSNVEMYLFENDVFGDFVKNVTALPIDSKSLFIRSANNQRDWASTGYRMSTSLQYISVFLKDYQEGLYYDYWTMVQTHAIPIHP